MAYLDLEQHLVFYGAYHHQEVNILIHVLCVPLLIATAQVMLSHYTLPLPSITDTIPVTIGLPIAIGYAIFYTLLEPFAGFSAGLLVVASSLYGAHLVTLYGSTAIFWAFVVHVGSWIAQFVGHGVYEKRAPALLDNPVHAFVLAPLFVWMEILFKFNYRQELQDRVQHGVEVAIRKAGFDKPTKAA